MPTVHLKHGGSTMARDVACLAWRELAAKLNTLNSNTSSPAAAAGSALHECMEEILLEDKTPPDFKDRYFEEWDYTVTEDDVVLLLKAMNAFDKLCEDYDLEDFEVEQFVQMTDEVGGSADVIIAGPDNTFIVDWKFGYNAVSPESSWQGATYLLSMMATPALRDLFKDKEPHFAIIQPKVHDDAQVYLYPPGELGDMASAMSFAVKAHAEGGHEPTAGPHCLFCPAAPTCPAKTMEATTALSLPNTGDLTEGQVLDLEQALELATQLEPWVKDVKNFAHKMLEQGAQIPGWKLVDKRATRKWKNNEEISDKLHRMRRVKLEEYANIAVKTPPQLEKVCKVKNIDFEKEFGGMVIAKSSGTTLAPDTDKRQTAAAELTQGEVTAALSKIAS